MTYSTPPSQSIAAPGQALQMNTVLAAGKSLAGELSRRFTAEQFIPRSLHVDRRKRVGRNGVCVRT